MSTPLSSETIRLTSLSHGGGCGCKIAPNVLQEILSHTGASKIIPPALLVGIETSDDAAVYQINDTQAIVATTDFFMPIVDNPYHFGQIAATNAISDVYAMGGTPLFALGLVGMPVNKLPVTMIRDILAGGESMCRKAGIPIAGGHTIDSLEPIYGLVVIGLVHPEKLKRNSGAREGDALILGKGLGVGIYSAAFKKNKLTPRDYETFIASTTQLNTPGLSLSSIDGVHALTDVTGFGLLGHLLEICRGSALRAEINYEALPILPNVMDYIQDGCITGASGRNWASYGASVQGENVPLSPSEEALLTDPQTSGGLLVACAPESRDEVLALFKASGFEYARQIGTIERGEPIVRVVKK